MSAAENRSTIVGMTLPVDRLSLSASAERGATVAKAIAGANNVKQKRAKVAFMELLSFA